MVWVLSRPMLVRCEVKLFLERMTADWDSLPPNMRKPLSWKEAVSLHQAAAMFLHFVNSLERWLGSASFEVAREKLRNQFFLGALDHELLLASETSVPPGDMRAVGMFRPVLLGGAGVLFDTGQFGQDHFGQCRGAGPKPAGRPRPRTGKQSCSGNAGADQGTAERRP